MSDLLLELADIPYTGSNVLSSSLAMHKVTSRQLFQHNGLNVPRSLVFGVWEWEKSESAVISKVEAEIGFPCVLKPLELGSSVGISKAHNQEELRVGLDEAARYDRKLIVEQGIEAREIEVSVLGNDDPIASVPGEIIPSREFYSYAAKYVDDASDLLIPAPIPEGHTEQIRRLAVEAYTAIDCAGMARVDFLMDKVTDKIWLNELNTIPGFTPISMYPKLWEATGISYTELIDRLIHLALERYEDKGRSTTSFDVSTAT